ncbi:hypothetical protein [Chryseobacterium taiwanense]|uniref:GAF domain-containing protein n=1 Tax=Chryseobacterium taiwanense TaxID=363331 RepID=A0A0B4E7X6_9FLAO|nr:hypothetical protein [Chryseobacterium taiwanense]KIC62728.1 hypothetical protein RM51_11095 [Chryseobacterium taiwanense]
MKIDYQDSPFDVNISFEALIKDLQLKVEQNTADEKERLLFIELQGYPAIKDGIMDGVEFDTCFPIIDRLLRPLFPELLTHNEIKAVTIPYTDFFFYHTERFKSILKQAGETFQLDIRNLDVYNSYIPLCCIILNEHYKVQLDLYKPLFYRIPDSHGNYKTYRILYNADFIDVIPTSRAYNLQDVDIARLIDNYDDIDLWKKMFPPKSYVLSGFAIINLVDVTVESAVSTFKESFIGNRTEHLIEQTETIINTIFKVSNLRCGLLLYKKEENKLYEVNFTKSFPTFISIDPMQGNLANEVLAPEICHLLFEKLTYFATSSLKTIVPQKLINFKNLSFSGSFLLVPVVYENETIAVLEVYCPQELVLNSISAQKLDIFMGYLSETLHRIIVMHQNKIQAMIQDHYTSIHESVYWKFHQVVEKYIQKNDLDSSGSLESIVFNNVYALYGQVDIKGSSEARNKSVELDLLLQLHELHALLSTFNGELKEHHELYLLLRTITNLLTEITNSFDVNTEQRVVKFLDEEAHGWLRKNHVDESMNMDVVEYFRGTELNGKFHLKRQAYSNTVDTINSKLSNILDDHQKEAQNIIPHYFERYKTDGVDFNLYVGAEIAPRHTFTDEQLYELRYWQLITLIDMVTALQNEKHDLPYPLGVTGLILVYHSPLSIRFRMDEKRFDVDGSYNVRYEVIKKRIDKARIKGSARRIVEEGKISVVYYSDHEKDEYLNYLDKLSKERKLTFQTANYLVEDLQNVVGLKVLQISF